VPPKPSGLTRILHLASFAVCSLPLMLRQLIWRPDVVWVVEPPLFCAPTALLVVRLAGARAWLHVQDYEVDAAFALGMLNGRRTRKMVSAMERWVMRRFDRVSTISEAMMALATKKGVVTGKLMLFPNWINLDAIKPLDVVSSYRAELGIPVDALLALYSDNMGGKQGLEIMGQAARHLAHEPDLYFVFCGNGSGKADLLAMAQGLPRVLFLDLQPMERLNDLLGLADIHLLPQRADAADLVMPSKLTGMLASGRAVVATAHPDTELGKVVAHFGMSVAPGNAETFADAIRELARDPVRRATCGIRPCQPAPCRIMPRHGADLAALCRGLGGVDGGESIGCGEGSVKSTTPPPPPPPPAPGAGVPVVFQDAHLIGSSMRDKPGDHGTLTVEQVQCRTFIRIIVSKANMIIDNSRRIYGAGQRVHDGFYQQ
jgi:colanic acid biosynthesis glycosyl transferase WcaI